LIFSGKLHLRKRESNGFGIEDVVELNLKHRDPTDRITLEFGSIQEVYTVRKQTSFNLDKTKILMTESFEITLSSNQSEWVVVHVEEALCRWTKWKIIASSPQHLVHEDEGKIYWVMNVKPKSNTKITYTVQYHSFPQP